MYNELAFYFIDSKIPIQIFASIKRKIQAVNIILDRCYFNLILALGINDGNVQAEHGKTEAIKTPQVSIIHMCNHLLFNIYINFIWVWFLYLEISYTSNWICLLWLLKINSSRFIKQIKLYKLWKIKVSLKRLSKDILDLKFYTLMF